MKRYQNSYIRQLRPRIRRTVLIRFLLAGLLELIFIGLIYLHSQGGQRARRLALEEKNLEYAREIVARDFIGLVKLLNLISGDPLMFRYLEEPGAENRQILAEHLCMLTCYNHNFKRFSLVDDSGREQIGTLIMGEHGMLVPHEELRDYSGTRWFRDVQGMEKKGFYISMQEPSREGGRSRQPVQGNFRIALPVYVPGSGKSCSLVIEYDYSTLLTIFREEFPVESSTAYFLVNREGEYLAASDPDREEGFFRTAEEGFNHDYPDIWSRIRFGETGRIITSRGVYLYSAGLLEQSVARMAPVSEDLMNLRDRLTGAMIIRLPAESLRISLFRVFPPAVLIGSFLVIGFITFLVWVMIRNSTYMTYLGNTLDIFFRGIEKNPASILLTDRDGVIRYVNPKFLDITGYREEEVLGENPRLLKSGKMEEDVFVRLWQTISGGDTWQGELLNKHRNGSLYWVFASISPIRDRKGRITHYMGIQEDISEIKQYQEHLKMLASEDPLTGLMNRRSFQMMLEKELERCSRYGRTVSVVMMDIDDFKRVNDTRGHQAGDEVLRKLGALLTDAVRSIDIPGRYGGEEFILALPETGLEEAVQIAERIRAAAEEMPVDWEELPIRFTLSLGVAAIPPEGSAEECIARADTCLYEAKERGKNRVCSP